MRLAALPLVLLAACASPSGIGHLDPEIVAHARERQGAWRAKLHVTADGSVRKVTVYHRDPAAVPAAIRELAMQRFPGGKVESYETELHDAAGWVHEVEITTAEGRNCEISASEPARLRYVECRIANEEVAPALLERALELVAGGALQEAETHEGENGDDVRLELLREGVVHYVVLDPTGTVLQHELRLPAILGVPAPR